ncbi:MAG: RNA methyltransferase [bacterium]
MSFPENLPLADKRRLLAYLLTFVSENKQKKFQEILPSRTRYITVVLEDIFQPHNASAVLRSCDCFGIQDVHIIENRYRYEVNPNVALGSVKWLNLLKYGSSAHNTATCLTHLKENEYCIVATSPHKDDFTPATFPLDQKFALLFGTEKEGLTEEALGMADRFIKIPMFGFTESLNISVSAAIFLHALTNRLHRSDLHWQLSEEEQTEVLLRWASATVKKSGLLISYFLSKQ